MRRWFHIAAPLLFAGLLFLPTDALAGGGGPTTAAGGRAASATLMAAALETAGYFAQQEVLDKLRDLLEKMGALVFLVCLISGLMTAALMGQYTSARWFLVGPVLFYFLIRTEPAQGGANWQFATFQDPTRERERILGQAGIEAEGTANVSWFFHQYNKLISEISQELIRILSNDDARKLMLFTARQNIMDGLFGMSVGEDWLIQLVRHVMTVCTDEIGAARLISIANHYPELRNSPEYSGAVTKYCTTYLLKNKQLDPEMQDKIWQQLEEPLKSMRVPAITIGGYTFGSRQPYQRKEDLRPCSCADMWTWIYLGLVSVSSRETNRNLNENVPQYYRSVYPQILRDIQERVSRLRYHYTDRNATQPHAFGSVPCYNFTVSGGSIALPGFRAGMTIPGFAMSVPRTQGLDGAELIPIIFSAWMLRKVLMNDPRSQMLSQLYDHAGVELEGGHHRELHSMETNQAKVRRFRNARLAEATKWEVYTLTMLLPYVQGAGLYVLSVLYPFFALMVIIPGRAGSFFMWCALWTWLKSWDVGWCFAMIIDQALWDMMPHTAYYRQTLPQNNIPGAGTATIIETDPVTVFEAAFSGDYSYTISTYYVLLAGVLTAVPVISAHAVLGSKKAIAGILVNGVRSIGQPLAKAAGDWVATEQVHEDDTTRELQQFMYARSKIEPHYQSLVRESDRLSSNISGQLAALYGRKSAQELGQKAGFTEGFFSKESLAETEKQIAALKTKAEKEGKDIFSVFDPGGFAGAIESPFAALGADPSNPFKGLRALFDRGGALEKAEPGKTGGPLDNPGNRFGVVTPQMVDETVLKGFKGGKYKSFAEIPLEDRLEAERMRANLMQYVDPAHKYWDGPTEEFRKWRQAIEMTRRDGDTLRAVADRFQLAGVPTMLTADFLDKMAGLLPKGSEAAKKFNEAIVANGGKRMTEVALAANETGTELQRLANAQSAEYLKKLAEYYYYEGGKGIMPLSAELRRGGDSGRLEWWNALESPEKIRYEVMQSEQNLINSGLMFKRQIDVQLLGTLFRVGDGFATGAMKK